ncbi:sepiapterin reductase [Plasmopara halstedii]|uniref:Sepiapterin reductase n=1 Tax=Plasmopara halstedii TaxID=4781 RepID=A0A0P1AK78_PLAHL|nr:sepiapterin reductase [Plasmopara halstedii]CEG41276.1 sepiapterin reductase [Plasmopara halstedii]|eukprot:XP_024577645.1 sepiapterin reductase [Plasmopara halstedii]
MKSAILITGASRGFGRYLALDFVSQLKAQSVDLHLWARDESGLKETERLALEMWEKEGSEGKLLCFSQSVDLSNSGEYTSKVEDLMRQLEKQRYDRVFLVHNAGSLGKLGLAQEVMSSATELTPYWELNVTSVMWLNNCFLRAFGASREELSSPTFASDKVTQLVIVNITSLCSIKPFKTHMLYCTGKAAREMHHRVIATEQAAGNKVQVLQYSPGPMDTEMQRTIRESPNVDTELQTKFREMKANGELVPTAQSSLRCVKLAINGNFESGAHVDYCDHKVLSRFDSAKN